jgi:hypothetical protein
MLGNILGFGHMYENKIFFFLLEREINLKVLKILFEVFGNFLEIFQRKPDI